MSYLLDLETRQRLVMGERCLHLARELVGGGDDVSYFSEGEREEG